MTYTPRQVLPAAALQAIQDAMDAFAAAGYQTSAQVAAGLATKSDVGHLHDDRYYTQASIDALMAAVTAATTPFTPAGTIAATNVQAAIEELGGDVSPLVAAITINGTNVGIGVVPEQMFHVAGNIRSTGYVEQSEIATPSTPAAGLARLYPYDDGGVTRYAYKDDAGAVRPISTRKAIPTVSLSGASVEITGILPGATEIVIPFSGLSTNGTSRVIVQLGDSGGYETAGYVGVSAYMGATTAPVAYSDGFAFPPNHSAASVYEGELRLSLVDPSTNTWAFSLTGGYSNTTYAFCGGGTKSLSAVLDRVRITTQGGTDTFDGGKIGGWIA